MHPLFHELKSAIQHALVVGLSQPSALDRLRAQVEPLRALELDPIAQLIEAVSERNLTDEVERAQALNELTRLWELCRQMQVHLQPEYLLSNLSSPTVSEDGWLVLDEVNPSWIALLEGTESAWKLVPALKTEIRLWTPEQPIQPILLGLSHGALTRYTGRRLLQLAREAVPTVISLMKASNRMVRVRAWEIALQMVEQGFLELENLHSLLKYCPPALPVVPKLIQLGISYQAILEPERKQGLLQKVKSVVMGSALDEFASLIHDRPVNALEYWNQHRQELTLAIMGLSEGHPYLHLIIGWATQQGGRTIAQIAHPTVTQMLLQKVPPSATLLADHLKQTLHYPLLDYLLAHSEGYTSSLLRAYAHMGDTRTLPMAIRDGSESTLRLYHEPVRLLAEGWSQSSDSRMRSLGRRLLKQGDNDEQSAGD